MIIVKIIGGLGNQMFQYAYAKALEDKGHKVKIDISAFETYHLHGGYQLDKYEIDLKTSTKEDNSFFYRNNILSKILKRLGLDNSKIIKENNLMFDEDYLNIDDPYYIDGYFQCEKYFQNIRTIVLNQFIMKSNLSKYSKNIEKDILNSGSSCSIHIRRGDFANNVNKNIHGTCDISYYKSAFEFINFKFPNMKYFIFSDDIEWTKNNLKIDNAIYIDNINDKLPHEDIYLMSLCKNNIIANSSFSWWGAWLNKNNEKIVIAPKKWFADDKLEQQSKDIACESWIKI